MSDKRLLVLEFLYCTMCSLYSIPLLIAHNPSNSLNLVWTEPATGLSSLNLNYAHRSGIQNMKLRFHVHLPSLCATPLPPSRGELGFESLAFINVGDAVQ